MSTKQKKNILIIGPFGDFGGRELETGFIAKSLMDENSDVSIISTMSCTSKSQIFEFIEPEQLKVLDDLVIKKNILFRVLAFISYLKSKNKKPLSFYASNKFSKKLGYRSYVTKALNNLIEKTDLVIVCAQISSAYVKDIVEFAFNNKKPVIIRTSSKISENDKKHKEWLEKVTLFFHHSESNAIRLSFLEHHNYQIIDQCTYREKDLLALTPPKMFRNILFIGRLSPEKGIIELVNYFKTYGDGLNLNIIGDGSLYDDLKTLSQSEDNINLLGYKSQDEIIAYINANDAIIISSFEESGPLVGLEGMAAGRIIISTKVGAMEERLKETPNQFWFETPNSKSFDKTLQKLLQLKSSEIETISNSLRDRYKKKYTFQHISSQYVASVEAVLQSKII